MMGFEECIMTYVKWTIRYVDIAIEMLDVGAIPYVLLYLMAVFGIGASLIGALQVINRIVFFLDFMN